jgi:hypothetical protein
VTVVNNVTQQPGEDGSVLAARVTQGVVWNLNAGITRRVGVAAEVTLVTLIYLDDRTTFTVEHDERYALGDPSNPLLVLNALDGDSCVWVADTPDGWEFPEVETPIDRRQDGHGGYAGEPTYNPRTLTVRGFRRRPHPEALRAAYSRLMAAVLGSVPSYVRYTHLDEPGAPGLWVLPTGKPKWRATDDRYAEFSFVLVADDPIKTGTAATYGPVRLPTA